MAAAAVALLMLAIPGPSPRAADRKAAATATHVTVGPLALDVPADWRRREGPAADNPHFDAPAEAIGFGPTVAISVEQAREETVAPGMKELSREWRDINGRRVQVRHWSSEEDGTRGLTVVLDRLEPGKLYQITGFMPEPLWNTRAAELWRVIGTLRVAGAGGATGQTQADARFGPVRRYDFGNKLAVINGPSAAYALKFDKPVLLRSIRTYHWNNGRGAAPGTIALRDAKGSMLGPWPAQGSPGQGGVPDAYWQANPGIVLPAGTYSIATSSDRTWATNREAGGRGFFSVEWQESLADAAPDDTAATGSPGGASDTTADTTEPTAEPNPSQNAATDNKGKPEATERKIGADAYLEAGKTQRQVLFDGRQLERNWKPHSAQGGDFAKHARIEGGALVVDVPKGSGWGKTGIYSDGPLLWFDGEGDDASARIDFEFDGARTDGFVVALAALSNLAGNDPSNPRFVVHWRRVGDKAKVSVLRDYDTVKQIDVPSSAPPAKLVLRLTKGKVEIVEPQWGLQPFDWPDIRAGQGLHVYAYGQANEPDGPARMALRQIVAERNAGSTPTEAKPTGAAPLPVTQLFKGDLGTAWQEASVNGADFAKYGRREKGLVTAEFPEKLFTWGKTGILSNAGTLNFDERSLVTPYRITLKFAPRRTSGTQIVFNSDKRQDMWPGHRASVALIRHVSGRYEGQWLLSVESDGYRQWSRPIDAGWMDKHWDGTLEIEAGERWLTARVPGGTLVRGTNLPLYKGDQLHMAVYAHPADERGGARMGLASITGQWLLPASASKIDRWTYVDNDKFDSKGFLDDLAKSAGIANAGDASSGLAGVAADPAGSASGGTGDAAVPPSPLTISAGTQAVYRSTSAPIYMVAKFAADALDATCAGVDGRAMRRFAGKTTAGGDATLTGTASFSEGIKSAPAGTLDYRFDRAGRRATTLWRTADGSELLMQWVRVSEVGSSEPLQPGDMVPAGNQEKRP